MGPVEKYKQGEMVRKLSPKEVAQHPELLTFRNLAQTLLNQFQGKNLEGLESEQMDTFLKEIGMSMVPMIVVDRTDLQEFLTTQLEGDNEVKTWMIKELQTAFNDVNYYGGYLPLLDIVIVIREKKLEELNSTVLTESRIIHEQVHANHPHFGWVAISHPNNTTPISVRRLHEKNKLNFETDTQFGNYLEEGLAAYFEGEYRVRYLSKEVKQQILQVLHLETYSAMYSALSMFYMDGVHYPFSPKYFSVAYQDMLNPDPLKIGVYDMVSGYAAVGLELLFQNSPKLKEVLLACRQNNTQVSTRALIELRQIINDLDPSLCSRLQLSPKTTGEAVLSEYTVSDFIANTNYIYHLLGSEVY